MKRLFVSVFACMVLLGCIMNTAQATDIDLSQKGSISWTFTSGGKAVPGGKLCVYQVSTLTQDGNRLLYAATSDFPTFRATADITSPALAKAMAEYAEENHVQGTTLTIRSDGTAVVENLTTGVYLVTQPEAAAGYYPIDPFLVSIPLNTSAGYDYSVDATPKVSPEPIPTEPTAPTEPPETTAPTVPAPITPGGSGSGKLPQTGMNNWPIPVFAIAGLFLFLSGWCLYRSGRKDRYED